MLAALRLPALLCLIIGLATSLVAQDPPTQLEPNTIEALENLAKGLVEKRQQLLTATAEEKEALEKEISDLKWQFAELTARSDVKGFLAPDKGEFNLEKEAIGLIEPVIDAIKSVTAESRQISAIESRLKELEDWLPQARTAQQTAERTRNLLPQESAARAEATTEIEQRWKPLIKRYEDEERILNARLQTIKESQKPFADHAKEFFAQRGLTLLLSTAAFFAVLFTMRWLQNRMLARRRRERAVSLRIAEVVFSALGLLLAIIATMIVPWMRQDFLLLSIGIVFLIGAGWVLVKMAPQFFEQIRLILNIGSVREGERIIMEGLPYRVDNLRFYSTLSNPCLQGGELRVPIQELIGRRSRVPGPGEPWFPSEVGDVVILDDDIIGPVTVQTPEVVVVDDYLAPRSYTAAAYLDQNPRNLSDGFSIVALFGIDYAHQTDATTVIPERLTQALRAELPQFVDDAAHIREAEVEFEAAGASSLDLEARAVFTGDAAIHYRELQRALQHILVDACTKNGWNIPFPQLTVHRAN
ncbi:MAG: hypothetical protein NXI31_22930 [bacterium]|nr:hypothetical protein [bacterium]